MISVVLRRLVWMIPLVIVVTLLSFVLASLAPGSVAQSLLTATGGSATNAQIAALNHQLGYDRPLIVQWISWIVDAVQGNLGESAFTSQPVSQIVASRLPVTLSLVIPTLVIDLIAGVGLGMLTAIRGGRPARAVEVVSVFLRSVPNFWLALILATVFAVELLPFPVSGYVPISQSFSGWAESLVLPVVALSVADVALIGLVTRAEMLTVLRSDFIKGLRANGIRPSSILFRHALKNALPPVLTVASVSFVSLLGGTILAEQVFGLAGLGSQMVQSTTQHDLPVIQGIVLFYTLVVVIVFLLNDVALSVLNPKVRVR